MPILEHQLEIAAPSERVFDLSRSIDLHQISTAHTGERAIGGRMQGLIELGESVRWRAKHFGIWQELSVKISAFEYPSYFCDEMQEGAFASFKHEHFFTPTAYGVLLRDRFSYRSPLGILGRVADVLFLKAYMHNFLLKRNLIIKIYAESDKWKEILPIKEK
ncbi:MAG: SRPBCC family protein [Bacteroidota bacterium]